MAGIERLTIKLNPTEAAKALQGLSCPKPGCDGKLQTYIGPKEIWVSCYRCGFRIDLTKVKLVVERKSKR